MEVIFDGRLSHELRMATVLRRVLDEAHAGNTLLRISCPQFSGRLLIYNGRYLQGAKVTTEGEEVGYPAVRRLMAAADGTFAYLHASSEDPAYVDPDLNLDLEKVIKYIPDLPESETELFDEKSLLDKVFSGAGEEPLQPVAPGAVTAAAASAKKKKTLEKNMWKLLQPLSQTDDGPASDAFAGAALGGEQLELSTDSQALSNKGKAAQAATGKRRGKNSIFSPMLAITIVGLLLAVEIVAIAFWKPLVTAFNKKGARQQKQSRGYEARHRRHR